MAAYIVAGSADDQSFARAEYAAKQVASAFPNIFFHFEMKHPDHWKAFIKTVFRKYDFHGYSEDYPGPLVWTQEGELIGGGAEFVQKVCVDKFGISPPPSVTEPMFKQIALDNLHQVKCQLHREEHGPSFSELCASSYETCSRENLIRFQDVEVRKKVVQGCCWEMWLSTGLEQERVQCQTNYGDGQPAELDKRLGFGTVGAERSHTVFFHPNGLVKRHVVVVPKYAIADSSAENVCTVKPHAFRTEKDEGLALDDFTAAAEVLISIGGVVTWSGIRGASEFRHPLDTHLQVMPFPVASGDQEMQDSVLSYPLELTIERALQARATSLSILPFPHYLARVDASLDGSTSPGRLAKAVDSLAQGIKAAYEQAAGPKRKGESLLVAFTSSWLLAVPVVPPIVGSTAHQAWLRLPPPHPCALCGVVLCPRIDRQFPETVGVARKEANSLISHRAEEEGIVSGTPEHQAALAEVRVGVRVMDAPVEVIGVWTNQQQ